MKTVFVRIYVTSMGDGWKDQYQAARAYADWLEKEKGVETEIINGIGPFGGSYDEFGEATDDSHYWWDEWLSTKQVFDLAE